jgi:hypothetical protein
MQQTIPLANKFASGLAPDPRRLAVEGHFIFSKRNRRKNMKKLDMTFASRAVIFSLLLVLVSGCAGPTQTIKRAEEFSVAGITYSDTVVSLLDVTVDRVISDDSDILIRQRRRLPPDQLEGVLNVQDAALVPLVKTIGSFRDSTRKLKAYFKALQALAGSKVEEEAGPAVGELVDSINAANKRLKESGKVVFNDEEKGFISTLASLAAKSVRANKIHVSIERSAAVIGEQLLLHEKLLVRVKKILEDSYQIEMDKLHNKIRLEYTGKDKELTRQWKVDRKNWVTTTFFVESLENSITAAKVMREKWEVFLSGAGDAESVALLLADVNEFLSAARGLKDVEK